MSALTPRVVRRISLFAFTLLAIEFFDELVFGIREAAWPLIRDELNLDYVQVGLLLGIPNIVSGVVEPFLGILGDVWRRRVLVLGGGIVYSLALLFMALSGNFAMLLIFSCLLYPASGAFVSLSQASLMDSDPTRHEHNMARWTFAGSLGVVAGTLAVSAVALVDIGWRPLFLACAGLGFALVLLAWRQSFPKPVPDSEEDEDEGPTTFRVAAINALRALRRGAVVRWLMLLQFSDLMLDVLLGFLALYFVDVAGVSPQEAAFAVTVWTVVGLAGDFLIIPLLERVRGLSYLRLSAAIVAIIFPTFLLAPELWQKLVCLALLGLFNAGWYSILQGQLYSSMPGQSGAVLTVTNLFGLVGGLLPLFLGFIADNYSLETTMWLLLAGPIAILLGLPRRGSDAITERAA